MFFSVKKCSDGSAMCSPYHENNLYPLVYDTGKFCTEEEVDGRTSRSGESRALARAGNRTCLPRRHAHFFLLPRPAMVGADLYFLLLTGEAKCWPRKYGTVVFCSLLKR